MFAHYSPIDGENELFSFPSDSLKSMPIRREGGVGKEKRVIKKMC